MTVVNISNPIKLLLGLLAAALIAAILIVVLGSGDDEAADGGPRLLTEAGLAEYARSSENPVYWAGPQVRANIELTAEADGSTFVRYLRPGADVGDPAPEFLTVATYPVDDAEANIEAAKARTGAIIYATQTGERAVSNRDNPTSVYVSPRPGIQVEIYDPSAERASEVARSGAIQTVR